MRLPYYYDCVAIITETPVTQKASVGMYHKCACPYFTLVYFLAPPSLLLSSILCNCFCTCYCYFFCDDHRSPSHLHYYTLRYFLLLHYLRVQVCMIVLLFFFNNNDVHDNNVVSFE